MLPLAASDLMWELSLPLGVNRDHEYRNPTVEGGSNLSEGVNKMRSLGVRLLLNGCDGDPPIDRQVEKLLKERIDSGEQFHGGWISWD
ncbi:hypothetical protein NL676_016365 [Syzygium grande]|nr:hypothetical protein NL676_016365 [Syzygium grande]